jgi:hypothetical protein
VHDGIHLEKAGIPSATICTDQFTDTALGMAKIWGAEEYPTIFTQHPIENLTRQELRGRMESLASEVAGIITGS